MGDIGSRNGKYRLWDKERGEGCRMRRIACKELLAISCDGHRYFILYDASRRSELFDYLFDLAGDVETPITWRDVFSLVDSLPRTVPQLT